MTITRLWQAGAELDNGVLEFTSRDSGSLTTVSSVQAKTGTYAFRGALAYGWTKIIPSTSQLRISYHFLHNGTSGDTPNMISIRNGSSSIVALRWDETNATIQLRVAGSQVDTYVAGGFSTTGQWFHIGLDVKIDASGWVYVYLDGIEIFAYEGDTTGNGSSANQVEWNELYGIGGDTWNTYYYIDDIYIDDTAGESAAAPVPDQRFHYRVPAGNGSSSDLTGSDGDSTDNYLLVDEIPHDGDTTYVEAASSGLRDLYDTTTFTLPTGFEVTAVIPTAVAKKTNAAIGSQLKLVAKDGVDEAVSSANDLATSYSLLYERMTTQPDGSAWDESGVNAAEYGVESAGSYS